MTAPPNSSSSSDRDPLDRLAEEFVARFRAGERPSLTEYAARLPERADEVRDLFPALVEMEQLKPATGDHTGDFVPAAPSDPQQIGEFRILRRVGVGGMGVVYEAMQESLGRHVALKLLPADALADPKRLERFRREAKAAAKLHHTNIVPVFGTGEADGRHYYAMQFIAGHPLDAVIAEVRRLKDKSATRSTARGIRSCGGLVTGTFGGSVEASARRDSDDAKPRRADASTLAGSSPSLTDGGRHYWAMVASVGAQIADALAYAHAQGIRILGASSRRTCAGPARDGLGDRLRPGQVRRRRRPDPRRRRGWHPAATSPRTVRRHRRPRADVYALGLTLYELLTLRPAFVAENRAKLVQEVTAATPKPPRTVNPAIPRDLETVVLKAIQRDPAARYQSAAELAADLRRYVEDRPILARRATAFEQTWRWCRRNPALAGALAAVVVAIAGGFAATVHQMNLARAEADRADENARHAEQRAKELDQEKRDSEQLTYWLHQKQDELKKTLYAAHLSQVPAALDAQNGRRAHGLLEAHRPTVGENDLRGFEWHYWKRRLHGEAAMVRVPVLSSGPRVNAALSRDGTRAAAHDSRGLWVWDTATGRVLAHRTDLRGPTAGLGGFPIVFSLDGTRLAAALTDADASSPNAEVTALAIVAADGGKDLATIPLNRAGRGQVLYAWSRDGNALAVAEAGSAPPPAGAAADPATVRVLDVRTGRERFAPRPLDGLFNPATIRFRADDARLVVVGLVTAVGARTTKSVALDAATGEPLPDETADADLDPLAFAADGRRLIDVTHRPVPAGERPTRTLALVDATGTELWRRDAPLSFPTFGFSPDGTHLVCVTTPSGVAPGGGSVAIWEAASGRERLPLVGLTGGALAAAFRPDGKLVTLEGDGSTKTWDLSPPPPPVRFVAPRFGIVREATITPDGRTAAQYRVAADDGRREVVVRDETGRELLTAALPQLDGDAALTPQLDLSADGTRLAILVPPRQRAGAAAPASAGVLAVWDVAAGRSLRTIPVEGSNNSVTPRGGSVALSRDGRVVAAVTTRSATEQGAQARVVEAWEAETGRSLGRFPVSGDNLVTSVAVHPDGRQLAIGSGGFTNGGTASDIREIDLDTGTVRPLGTLSGTGMASLRYSPDGRWLAACEGPRFTGLQATPARLLPVAGGEPRTLPGDSGSVKDIAFSPDNRRVATLSAARGARDGRGEIKLWDPDTGSEVLTLPLAKVPSAVRFSADGRTLYVFDGDGRHAYDATPLPVEAEAADVVDRFDRFERRDAADERLDRLDLAPTVRARAAELVAARQPGSNTGGRMILQMVPPRGQLQDTYRSSLEAATAALGREPESGAAWLVRGAAEYRLGRPEDALRSLTKAADLTAATPEAGASGSHRGPPGDGAARAQATRRSKGSVGRGARRDEYATADPRAAVRRRGRGAGRAEGVTATSGGW
ncbi:MAG: protein kinase [Gemmataceae bacterium]